MVTSWPSYLPACSMVMMVMARFSVVNSNEQFSREEVGSQVKRTVEKRVTREAPQKTHPRRTSHSSSSFAGEMMSPMISQESFIEAIHDSRSTIEVAGTISAMGLPWRVMRIGWQVRRTCSNRAEHLALSSEMGTSIIIILRRNHRIDDVRQKVNPVFCVSRRLHYYSQPSIYWMASNRPA